MANVPTVAHSETSPAGSQAISLGDNRIREFKTQVREIVAIDHKMDSSGQGATWGYHKQMTLIEAADIGTGAAGLPILGAQTAGGKGELTFTDEDDNDIQMTSGGEICILASGEPWRTDDLLFSGSGSTPTGWTDVTATYNGKFFRISTGAAKTTGGSDTHTHTGPSHTHSVAGTCSVAGSLRPGSSASISNGGMNADGRIRAQTFSVTSGADGTGNTGSGDNVPAYVQGKCYEKD